MKYKTIPASTNLYFITSRIAGHHHLFVSNKLSMIIMDSLAWMRNKKIWKLYAFCLMPNHLHIIAKILDGRPMSNVMGQLHSYTGHKIVEHLKQHHETNLFQPF